MLAWEKKVSKGCWLFSTQGMRKCGRAGEKGNVSSGERDSYKGGVTKVDNHCFLFKGLKFDTLLPPGENAWDL